MPRQAPKMKRIILRKTMILPDDTLEYWGFFLLKGATVKLKVCSKHEGSRIMVVKGEKNLRTCGLLEHNQKKNGASFNPEKSKVKVTFEHHEEIRNEVHSNNHNLPVGRDNIAIDDESSYNHGGEDLSETEKKPQKHRAHPKFTLIDTTDRDLAQSPPRSEMGQRLRRSHAQQTVDYQLWPHLPPHQARDKRDTIFDGRIAHGGNNQEAVNKGKIVEGKLVESESSESSFENGLFDCFDGNILAAREFNSSKDCAPSSTFNHSSYMTTVHEVDVDGYYYYIFYSDNDLDQNEINAVFEIQKPTYLYSNISETKQCSNSTLCSFPMKMWVLVQFIQRCLITRAITISLIFNYVVCFAHTGWAMKSSSWRFQLVMASSTKRMMWQFSIRSAFRACRSTSFFQLPYSFWFSAVPSFNSRLSLLAII